MTDDVRRAVLARADVARYLEGSHGGAARRQIERYVAELQTTQRYAIYRSLKHPLYPILRKIERIGEHVDSARAAARAGRVVYASNHRSHADYLVEPLVLDDNGIRPPVLAASFHLFSGPMGLVHRQVTGAVPIRRDTRDALYLTTLKAYVAELLRRHDLFFYPEGGRSYTGQMKPPKTGLLHAAVMADHPHVSIVPTAIAYDLVLEDRALARQRNPRPFSREVTELIRFAVGYRSRAFVTFGRPISVRGIDPGSRSAVLELAQAVMDAVGRQYKVLPTAVVAAAMRTSMTPAALADRAQAVIDSVGERGGNLGVLSGEEAVDAAVPLFETRGVLAIRDGRIRVRDRTLLRYYRRGLEHLLGTTRRVH